MTTLRRAEEEAQHCPATQFITVSDSEADIYEFLVEANGGPPNSDWIVRACQDRALSRDDSPQSGETLLRARVLETPVLFQNTIAVRGRTAKVACETRGRRSCATPPGRSRSPCDSVTLRPPRRPDRQLPPVAVNVVLVSEINPPSGDEPVEWLLVTSLPIDDVGKSP